VQYFVGSLDCPGIFSFMAIFNQVIKIFDVIEINVALSEQYTCINGSDLHWIARAIHRFGQHKDHQTG
jgi:hypothetical protein